MRSSLFIFFLLILPWIGKGQVLVSEYGFDKPIGLEMQFFKADTAITALNEIRGVEFEPCRVAVPNFNVSKQAVWLRFNVINDAKVKSIILSVAQPQLESVEAIVKRADGSVSSAKMGFYQKFNQRLISNQNYCFPVDVSGNEMITVYLRIISGGQIQVPVYVGTSDQMTEAHGKKDIFFGVFSGVMAAMFFYNLFVFLFSKERSYLLYVIYIGVVYTTQANFQGYTIRFFWPDYPWLEYNATTLLSCLAGISATLFFIDFVHLREFGPQMLKWLRVFIGIYVISILLAICGQPQIAYVVLQANAFMLAIALMVMASLLFKAGVRQALYFLIAWSVFLVGVCVFILKDYSIVEYNSFTYNIMSVGSALEAVFLSIALAERINVLKKEKEQSQALAMSTLKEKELLVRKQNEELEEKVAYRTVELQKSNRDLTKAMTDLKNAQIKLIENEKLASLGQLVAGIAHELNNPINFVSANVSPLRRDIAEYFSLAELANQLAKEPYEQNRVAVAEKLASIEQEGLSVEIEKLLKGVEDGADRTAEIVKGLRIFSRLDEQDLKRADVNDCIKSTLVVMKTIFRNNVSIETYFAPLTQIDCYPGKLNQVFMNVLSNAYHALKAAGKSFSTGVINIRTSEQPTGVLIVFKDNGTGMTEDVRRKIFDPFFTTKEVGEGTGLGMSIVLGIINDHKGSIEVVSSPDEGTEISIHLPRNLPSGKG